MLSVLQRYRRTTYDSNTALALRASRGKNENLLKIRTVQIYVIASQPPIQSTEKNQ